MTNTPELGQRRKINWLHVNTVLSAAVLIGAEVFGAAYAGGWAVENLTGLGTLIIQIALWIVSWVGVNIEIPDGAGVLLLRGIFFLIGIIVMLAFIRQAQRVEPFTTPR
jgi:uncharacterized membrane protein YkgB